MAVAGHLEEHLQTFALVVDLVVAGLESEEVWLWGLQHRELAEEMRAEAPQRWETE